MAPDFSLSLGDVVFFAVLGVVFAACMIGLIFGPAPDDDDEEALR